MFSFLGTRNDMIQGRLERNSYNLPNFQTVPRRLNIYLLEVYSRRQTMTPHPLGYRLEGEIRRGDGACIKKKKERNHQHLCSLRIHNTSVILHQTLN